MPVMVFPSLMHLKIPLFSLNMQWLDFSIELAITNVWYPMNKNSLTWGHFYTFTWVTPSPALQKQCFNTLGVLSVPARGDNCWQCGNAHAPFEEPHLHARQGWEYHCSLASWVRTQPFRFALGVTLDTMLVFPDLQITVFSSKGW